MNIRRLATLFKAANVFVLLSVASTTNAQTLLPGYNNSFYPDVFSAALDIAKPFLYQQGYLTQQGLTVNDTVLVYNANQYDVYDNYLNPATGYYVASADYATYGIQNFQTIWPTQIPYVLYNSSETLFNGTVDCVGYGTRLLSAVGDTSTDGNAYLNIINTIRSQNYSPFAHKGYVATAYQFAVAFPTLPTSVTNGWEYICGNVEDSLINAYNHNIQSGLNDYNGVRKGGFAETQAGDVMAFGYSAASSSNGHFVILEKQPQLLDYDSLVSYLPAQSSNNLNELLSRFNVYAVPVYDCSGLQAHFRDSRTQMSGIGHGTLIVLTDPADDAPMGYIFDTLQVEGGTLTYDSLGSHVYAISVGRFVTTSTAVQQTVSAEPVSVYPNPTSGVINLKLQPASGISVVTLFNMLGQEIKAWQLDDLAGNGIYTLNPGNISAGAYMLRVSDARGNELRKTKIIITRKL